MLQIFLMETVFFANLVKRHSDVTAAAASDPAKDKPNQANSRAYSLFLYLSLSLSLSLISEGPFTTAADSIKGRGYSPKKKEVPSIGSEGK
jgi:hypothetical protein